MKLLPAAVLLSTCSLLPACSWVKLQPGADAVTVRTLQEVGSCKYLGTATGKTRARVLIARSDRKVAQEVLDLARNEALNIGGNTLVPRGERVDGRQTFAVYLCR